MQTSLRKSLIVSAFALSAATIGHTAGADPGDNIHWQSVIGIVQGNNVVGSGSGAATGVPGPWSAQGGRVKVDLDHGRIDFDIDGLVFAAGNSIGTTGTITQVKGTLVCDTNGSASTPVGNSVIVDTPLVDLSDDGDAHFHGSVGALPAACLVEPDSAFLIRTAAGRWIANGTVLR
jgi:hypothetical protein